MGLGSRTVGVVGMGKVGQAIAQRLRGFDAELIMRTQALDPVTAASLQLTHAGFEELICRSDYTIIATPLNSETLHLIDAGAIRMMKPGAILVNPGRGSVVDEEAVATALSDSQLPDMQRMFSSLRIGHDRTDRDRYRNACSIKRSEPCSASAPPCGCPAIEAEAATSILEAARGSAFGCDQRQS